MNNDKTIQIIEKALIKANQDLNNSASNLNCTSEYLIELLTDLKDQLTPKIKCDEYEVRREFSHNCERLFYEIYKNNIWVGSEDTMEKALYKLEMLKTNITLKVSHLVISE
jgi:hypothetical protein